MRSAPRSIVLSFLVAAFAVTPVLAQHAAAIGGRVISPDGLPLAGVSIVLTRIDLTEPSASTSATAITGRDGRYDVKGLTPGNYSVTFTRAGFRTTTRTDVRAARGVTIADATLVPRSQLSDTFEREMLDQIPTARDPWVVMTLTPSVVLNGVNVGGSASGQQLLPSARGAGTSQIAWDLNGATTTDMAAISSPQYYDFGALETMRVTTGGADVSTQTAGVNVSLVTRTGTNQFHGSARQWLSGSGLQASNVTPALFAQGAGAGVPLKGYAEYGAEAGGPVITDRLWWWAGYGEQNINRSSLRFYQTTPECSPVPKTFDAIAAIAACLYPDRTWLKNTNVSVTYRTAVSQTLNLSAVYEHKVRNVRDASATTALADTARQTGGQPAAILRHEWLAGQHVAMETVGAYIDAPFDLAYRTDLDKNRRTSASVQTTADVLQTTASGTSSTLKFGFGYRRSPSATYSQTLARVSYQASGTLPPFVSIYREYARSVLLQSSNGFVQESIARGPVTFSAGIRLDHQDDSAPAVTLPANPLRPDLLPAGHFAGVDPAVDFTDLAPRLSASYRPSHRRSTVVSASYGAYFGQGVGLAQPQTAVTGRVYAVAPWIDANHDGVIQANEVTGLGGASVLDPKTGLAPGTASPVDPNLRNYRTREWTMRVDHDLAPSWSAGATYIARIYDQDRWTCCTAPTSSYEPYSWTDQVSGISTTYYWLSGLTTIPTPTTTNRAHTSDYRGLELALHKRLVHRWALEASYTRQRSIAHWPAGSFQDPTGIAFLDGRPEDLSLPRFVFRTHGTVTLPWNVRASGALNIEDGFIRQLVLNGPVFYDTSSAPRPLTFEPLGTHRYPSVRMLDAQFDKVVTFGRRRMVVSAVVFNVLNTNSPTLLANNVSRPDFGTILDMVGPRVLRVGATVHF